MLITSVIILASYLSYIWRGGNIQSRFFMHYTLKMTIYSALWLPYSRYIRMHQQSMCIKTELRHVINDCQHLRYHLYYSADGCSRFLWNFGNNLHFCVVSWYCNFHYLENFHGQVYMMNGGCVAYTSGVYVNTHTHRMASGFVLASMWKDQGQYRMLEWHIILS